MFSIKTAKSKYSNMSIQAKAALWFVACSFLQKGISFITVPVFARVMSTESYGTYNVYLSWFQFFSIITSLNLYYGVLDNGLSKFEDDRDRYISSMQGLGIVLTCVFFIVYLLGMPTWTKLVNLTPVFMGLMFVELFVSPALSYWSGRQRFEYEYKKLVAVTLLRSILVPTIGLLFVTRIADQSLGRVLATVTVEVAICGCILISQFKKGKVFFDRKYWRYGLVLAVPMLPHYLSGTLLSQGDRIMIERIVGYSEVAFYSVAYSIGMLSHIFTNAVNSAITPWFYKKFKSEDYLGMKSVTNGLIMIVALVSFLLMLVSPELVLMFGSGEYLPGQFVVPPVAASVFFIFLYGIFSLPEFYFEKTKFLMIASCCAAGLNLVLNYIFINKYGFVAAGYTTLACYTLYSIGHYIISRNILKKSHNEIHIFDIKFISVISIVLIGMAALVHLLFPYRIVRFGVILVVVFVTFLKRNTVIESLSAIKKQKN